MLNTQSRILSEDWDFIKHSTGINEKVVFTHLYNYDSDILISSILSKR